MEAANIRLPCPLTHDFSTAALFVRTIAGDAPVSFRLYTDKKGKKSSLSFAGSIDALWNRLVSENDRGMAVCMTINGASNGGLDAQDIDRIRAVFVDLDGAPLAPVLASALPPHFINETSKGRFHAFWLVDDLPVKKFREVQATLAGHFGADEHVVDEGRVMRIPGFIHQKDADHPFLSTVIRRLDSPRYSGAQILEWVATLLPAELMDSSKTTVDTHGDRRRRATVTQLCADVANAPEGKRNSTLNRASFQAGRFVASGECDREAAEARLAEAGIASGLDPDEVENVVGRALDDGIDAHNEAAAQAEDEIEQMIAAFNEKHAVVDLDGKVVVAKIPVGRGSIQFQGRQDLFDWYANDVIPDPDTGRPTTTAKVWWTHPKRKEYISAEFAPGIDLPADQLNLWRGRGIDPQPGDCTLYKRLVKEAICAGNEEVFQYVWKYLAHLVQCPNQLPEIALVLQGLQGTGKNCFVKPLRDIVGREHYLEIADHEHLVGRFTGHMSAKLVLVVNEASWGGYTKDGGIVKALITDPFQQIERKGITPVSEANFKRCFFLSNNDWVVGMDADDRRFVALEVSPVLRDEPGFFDRFHAELASGGTAALLEELLDTDLVGFDPRVRPKVAVGRTVALEQKIRGFDAVQRFWYESLNSGLIVGLLDVSSIPPLCWPTRIAVSHLNELVGRFSESRFRHSDRPSSAVVGRKLNAMCQSMTKKRRMDGATRVHEYHLPPLDQARAEFERLIGCSIDWDT